MPGEGKHSEVRYTSQVFGVGFSYVPGAAAPQLPFKVNSVADVRSLLLLSVWCLLFSVTMTTLCFYPQREMHLLGVTLS